MAYLGPELIRSLKNNTKTSESYKGLVHGNKQLHVLYEALLYMQHLLVLF